MNKGNIYLYLMNIGIAITIFNIFNNNQKLINFLFLFLIGVYYFILEFIILSDLDERRE